MIPITREQVRSLAPKIIPVYLDAFETANELFAHYGINANAKRLRHFMAQVLHESGEFTVLEENLWYRAPRILEVFGKGKHSAAITATEAPSLAGLPKKLAERVYGLGNPRKAKELGNQFVGDGYKYRGRAAMQTTGGAAYKRLSALTGVDFQTFPEKLLLPQYVLFAAVAEWEEKKCNAIADGDSFTGSDETKNPALLQITKKINGGTNGLRDRAKQLKKTKAVWP